MTICLDYDAEFGWQDWEVMIVGVGMRCDLTLVVHESRFSASEGHPADNYHLAWLRGVYVLRWRKVKCLGRGAARDGVLLWRLELGVW